MNESNEEFRESGRDIFEYLSSLRLLSSDLDVTIKTLSYSGVVAVRGGTIVSARTGDISGNGALFTLATQGVGEIVSVKSTEQTAADVTVSYDQLMHICKKVPPVSAIKEGADEAQLLKEAKHLFLQFHRKQAGTRLVEILKGNRFFYPAWLWHSRLMNRAEYLTKALSEMKKWGGHDPVIAAEIAKLSPQLTGKSGPIKRCIFCWAIVGSGQEYCPTCNCFLSISAYNDKLQGNHGELKASLELYNEEFALHPENSRIAYCLCLGTFSLGKIEDAKEYLDKALRISPGEQLFLKTEKFLNNLLPKKQEPKASAPKVEVVQPPARAAVSAPSSGRTILVVEDSNTSRKVISMVLKRQGYGIVEATTGGEGIARLVDVVPDLVLLDVMLPDMDGYQVLGEIRSSSRLKDVPVVMLTGKKGSTDRMKGLAGGANEYLTKPFDPAKLIKVLDRFVAGGGPKPKAPPKAPAKRAAAPKPAPPVTKKVVQGPIRPAAKVAEPKPAVVSLSGPSILVVEDSPTTRKVISMVLNRKGYPLREVTTGKQALQAIAEQPPVLILLDAMLPDMTGYSILQQLQKKEALKKIPVVMLTAKTGASDRQRGMQAGAVAYLTKPFDPNKLISTISQYLPADFAAEKK